MAPASQGTDVDVDRLVDLGEAALLEKSANHVHKLRKKQIVIKQINLGMTELSHLHAQLNSITTQATLIVGFAVASLSADTLAALASDTGQFCIYKSMTARALGAVFVNVSVFCIFSSYTVITCATAITTQSNRRCFDYGDTKHIVRMTSYLMYGDSRELKDFPPGVRPSFIGKRGLITFFFNSAFMAFFVSTGTLLWLFLFTNSWVRLKPEDQAEALAAVAEPLPGDPNNTVFNPEVIRTTRGVYAVRCTNPYDYEINDAHDNAYGIGVTVFATLILVCCMAVLLGIPRHVAHKFDPRQLEHYFKYDDQDDLPRQDTVASDGAGPPTADGGGYGGHGGLGAAGYDGRMDGRSDGVESTASYAGVLTAGYHPDLEVTAHELHAAEARGPGLRPSAAAAAY